MNPQHKNAACDAHPGRRAQHAADPQGRGYLLGVILVRVQHGCRCNAGWLLELGVALLPLRSLHAAFCRRGCPCRCAAWAVRHWWRGSSHGCGTAGGWAAVLQLSQLPCLAPCAEQLTPSSNHCSPDAGSCSSRSCNERRRNRLARLLGSGLAHLSPFWALLFPLSARDFPSCTQLFTSRLCSFSCFASTLRTLFWYTPAPVNQVHCNPLSSWRAHVFYTCGYLYKRGLCAKR